MSYSIKEVSQSPAEVLVICSAYNQEKYIADALEGFVSQRTDFPFVVLVHDDASTDSTADIIRGYESRYPDRIKGIYETVNQYQKGEYFWYVPYLKHSRAKYLALCEGDDYWIDPGKLQKQYDTLENDSCGVFSFSNAIKVDASTGQNLGLMLPSTNWEKKILEGGGPLSAESVIQLNFIPTASFFARIDAWLQQPELPKSAFSGDRAHQLFLANCGNSYCINESTCVYRVSSDGSMMALWNSSRARQIESIERYISLYAFFDEYTCGKYREALSDFLNDKKLSLMFATANKEILTKKEALAAAQSRGLKYKILTYLFYISPNFVSHLWKMRFSS